jgi:uncharacterized protein (DUF2267 family)
MNYRTHFDKFLAEHNEFIYFLSRELNEPNDEDRVVRTLKAVLYTLRERLTVQQSFHVLAQLPMFLKLYYIEEWKYPEKPVRFGTIEEFCSGVRDAQFHFGERKFSWDKSTEEIVNIVLASLRKYLDDGTIRNIFAELPVSLHPLFA